jgi:tryptophanyl-tRNA synthetase
VSLRDVFLIVSREKMFKQDKAILFSGIQPSGALTLGNYIGAIKNWVELQERYNCLFSIVDLHAITVRQDPKKFREQFYDAVALNIVCGLDPKKNIIFAQSHVAEHCELAWILNCYTYMGELGRMTQFKDKSKKYESNINAGLFTYPVLMAADILLYKTKLVPVGRDQKQHLELARDLAIRFNGIYGDIFVVPEVFLPKVGEKIMSLQDPAKKMSKSDENKQGVIFLLDGVDVIRDKLKRAVTDSGKEVRFDAMNKPGVANLLTILSVISGNSIEQLEQDYVGQGYGKFKGDVAEALIAFLAPMQARFQEVRQDRKFLDDVLARGAEAARAIAAKTLSEVQVAVGIK